MAAPSPQTRYSLWVPPLALLLALTLFFSAACLFSCRSLLSAATAMGHAATASPPRGAPPAAATAAALQWFVAVAALAPALLAAAVYDMYGDGCGGRGQRRGCHAAASASLCPFLHACLLVSILQAACTAGLSAHLVHWNHGSGSGSG